MEAKNIVETKICKVCGHKMTPDEILTETLREMVADLPEGILEGDLEGKLPEKIWRCPYCGFWYVQFEKEDVKMPTKFEYLFISMVDTIRWLKSEVESLKEDKEELSKIIEELEHRLSDCKRLVNKLANDVENI